jgi:hypothetical protein
MKRNRVLALLPLFSLVAVACSTKNVPLVGFDKQPDGTLLLQGSAILNVQAVISVDTPEVFRLRFNGKYGVTAWAAGPGGSAGPFEYLEIPVDEWMSGILAYTQVPPDTYVVELVDAAGNVWGVTPPLDVQSASIGQPVTAIFVHLDGRDTTWVIDPATQDADPTTLETTVSNLSAADVVVQHCQSAGTRPGTETGCSALGTIAPGSDFDTVETLTMALSTTMLPALVIGPFQRTLSSVIQCQIDRIVVTGTRTLRNGATTSFAVSTCNPF